MSILRRPDDHRRGIRRRAPRAVFIAEPDQDRHLMIDVAPPSPPHHRFFPRPSPSAAPAPAARRTPPKKPRFLPPRRELSPPPASEVPPAIRPPAQNLHRSGPPNQPQPPRGFLLGRLSHARPAAR